MKRIIVAIALCLTAAPLPAAQDLAHELALIESWLYGQRAYDQVPAVSAAVVHDQDILWSGASGWADLERRQAARADTIYGICSISKLFTGIAVMQLRDQGKYRLDDPVSALLPWFELEQSFGDSPAITLRGMLTHSAGLPRESDTPYWMPPDFNFPTRDQVREILGGQATIYPADRYYQYSNLGLTLAGEIVAQHAGQDYDAYVREHILQPLALDDTETGFPDDDRAGRIATGYSFPGRGQPMKPMPRYDARAITPAAGFSSTALDLARFAAWQFRLLSGRKDGVLAPNTLREMQRIQWVDWDWSVARGLAFGVYDVGGRTLSGHGGDCPGFNTRLYLDPLSRYAVSVMANRNRVDVDGYAAVIFDILESGATTGEAPEAENLADYTGSFDHHPWDGELMVVRWGAGLGLLNLPTMDPVGGLVPLRHVEGDRFHTVRPDNEPGHEVRFRRDGQDRVTHLVSHSLALPRLVVAED